jgi:hypothetical protein
MRRRDRGPASKLDNMTFAPCVASREACQHGRATMNSVLRHASAEKAPTCLALRHSRQLVFYSVSCLPSTSLRSLRSIPVTGFHCYYGRSDSCPVGSSVAWRQHERRLCAEQVSLLHAPKLPIPPSPNTRHSLDIAFARYPLAHRVSRHIGSRLHHLASKLASADRPNRVRHPTDGSFASCCSPPRLTTTQLHSATGRRTYTWRGLSPLCSSALVGALAGPFKARITR